MAKKEIKKKPKQSKKVKEKIAKAKETKKVNKELSQEVVDIDGHTSTQEEIIEDLRKQVFYYKFRNIVHYITIAILLGILAALYFGLQQIRTNQIKAAGTTQTVRQVSTASESDRIIDGVVRIREKK